ncbi:UNVERIFIED_CONTAM: hypothetical protein Sangu_0955100 [Sesamum angustifolium]|uniref:Uncharacterized protein n=1 Tax=Sesamum angustifolium TaxID=2727405 RepID=A0AAW2PFH4_9LAMI
MAIVPERTINDMTSPDLNQQPLCIEYPDLEVNFELKSGLIHLLPTFRGLAGEDPHKHLKEFHVVCSGMRPQGVTEEQIKLRAFLSLLPIKRKTGYISYLRDPSQLGTTSRDGSSRNISLPRELQQSARDKRNSPICRRKTVKYGQKIDRRSQRRSTVQQDSNRSTKLISIMASNTQQFGTRYDDPPRRSNEEIFGQQQRRYDPFSNLQPRVEGSPELELWCTIAEFQRPQYRPPMPPPSNPKQVPTKCSAIPTKHSNEYSEFGVSNESAASSVSKLESQGKLPSQTVINPKQNASAIVLRSGKELQENRDENGTKRGHAQQRKPEKEVEIPQEQDDETKEDNPKVLITKPPFRREVNIPLLDAIKQIPRYARFLKELCTSKGKLKGNERKRGVVIQLADRSVVYPEGVLEDVLVQVNELVFPADFYVLDMREDNSPSSTSILLGRPFLKTARTKIDVHAGTLSMEFDGEIIKFNIFYSMRYPSDIPTVLFVDAFDPFVQKFPAIDDKDYIKLALEESPMPMEEENMGVDPLVQVNAKFDGDSAFLAKINKDLTYGPRTYKNKAFHDKKFEEEFSYEHQSFHRSTPSPEVKKPQLPSSKKHRPMYHYHNPPDNAAGKPATAATVRRSPPSSATVIGNISHPHLISFLPCGLSRMSSKNEIEERNDTNMADVAGTTPHQQTTLDDIARRIARMEANLIDLFEHVGLTPGDHRRLDHSKTCNQGRFLHFLNFYSFFGLHVNIHIEGNVDFKCGGVFMCS